MTTNASNRAGAPASSGASSEIAAWPPARQARQALALLLAAYILAFIDRIILSILIRPITAELHLSDMQFACVGGVAFSMFYVAVGLPIGWMVDRLPRRLVVVSGIALWSLCTAASGLATGFGSLFAARMGVGIGEAALTPAAYSLIADYFPPQRRGQAVATYTLGVSLGSSVAYLLGGLLLGFAHRHGGLTLPVVGTLAPWRFVFLAVGLPGLALAALTLTMREPPRRLLGREDGAQAPSLWAFLKRRPGVSAAYVLGYSSINLGFSAFSLWGPAMFERLHHMGPAQLALPLAAIFLVPTALGQWGGAALTNRALARGHADAAFRTGTLCALLLIPVAIAMPLAPSGAAALWLLALLVLLVCGSVGHHAVVAASIAPNRLRGLYIALFLFVQNVMGQALGPLVTAFLTDHVYGSPLAIGHALAWVGGFGAVAGVALLSWGRGALRRAVTEAAQDAAAPSPGPQPVQPALA